MRRSAVRLFVSAKSAQEAMVCASVAQHLDFVDVKQPGEGALGGHYPWVIKAIREATPRDKPLSATLGDAPFGAGTMALAALGAAVAGADCIMAGLSGVTTPDQAIELMRGIVRGVKDHNRDSTVVAVGYGDARRVGSVNPLSVPWIAYESGADWAMLDTAIKDGSSLFDHLSPDSCGEFVSDCHRWSLRAALAGSVNARHVRKLAEIQADVIGVRGAVCADGDRRQGTIKADLILALRQAIDEAEQEHPNRSGQRLSDDATSVS
jgi:hypothetical protein